MLGFRASQYLATRVLVPLFSASNLRGFALFPGYQRLAALYSSSSLALFYSPCVKFSTNLSPSPACQSTLRQVFLHLQHFLNG